MWKDDYNVWESGILDANNSGRKVYRETAFAKWQELQVLKSLPAKPDSSQVAGVGR